MVKQISERLCIVEYKKIHIIFYSKRLFAGKVPVNKKHLTGTVPSNKEHLTGTIHMNKEHITITLYIFWGNGGKC